ncbi:hypothetical protein HYV44_00170 [Candidatus Microgenomates bacterium]|nr:hypothetical protein [Candidatus Microgenomates bacterium]
MKIVKFFWVRSMANGKAKVYPADPKDYGKTYPRTAVEFRGKESFLNVGSGMRRIVTIDHRDRIFVEKDSSPGIYGSFGVILPIKRGLTKRQIVSKILKKWEAEAREGMEYKDGVMRERIFRVEVTL